MTATHKEINSRLRAGAIVVLIEDPDEALTRQSAEVAAKQFEPVTVMSAADPNVMEAVEKHKSGDGTLILLDFLRTYGSNPVAVRLIREVALQTRKDGEAYSHLIMIEVPGIEVPHSLRGDIEYLIPAMPDVKALKVELKDFVKVQDIKLPGNGENEHAIASAVAGLSRHEAMRLFARCYVEREKMDTVWLRREKATRVSERLGGALTFVDTTDLPSVGGMATLRSWLEARREAFGSEKAKEFGLPEPKGLILVGPPGTGKSLTPKSIALLWGLPLLRLDAGKLFGSLVGQSESQTRQAIEAAEACAPCILWIDEMEKGFSNNGGLDGGTSARVFGTFLTWLQEKVKPVFVVATANAVDGLPPELLRKGRFDEIFYVDLPNLMERNEITKIHLERRERKGIDSKQIATATEGFSGSEIEQAIIEGMFSAFAEKRDVKLDDILKAVRGTVPLSKTMGEKLKALKVWAEGRAKFASPTLSREIADEPGARGGAKIR